MFIPNEIITEILNISDYLTWIDKIKKVNQQYHSYYKYETYYDYNYKSLCCNKHGGVVANWRNGPYDETIVSHIYPICVNSKHHLWRVDMISQIKLPHNY